MDNTAADITQFVSQANGIEQQLVNARQSFEKYTEAVRSKLQTVHSDLISQWSEERCVNGKSVTLADHWEWPPKRHKPFDNQYYAQSFKLENPGSGDVDRIITCEFFFNIKFDDGYVVSDPESDPSTQFGIKRIGADVTRTKSLKFESPIHITKHSMQS